MIFVEKIFQNPDTGAEDYYNYPIFDSAIDPLYISQVVDNFNTHSSHFVVYLDKSYTIFSCLHGSISTYLNQFDFEQLKALNALGSPFMRIYKVNDKYLLTAMLENWRYGFNIDMHSLRYTGFSSI